jgi:putative membrane protein
MYDRWGYGGMGAGGWILMSFFSILVIAALVVGIVALVRYSSSPATPPAGPPSDRQDPEEILRLRLARGEIEPEEYERRLAALRVGSPG